MIYFCIELGQILLRANMPFPLSCHTHNDKKDSDEKQHCPTPKQGFRHTDTL